MEARQASMFLVMLAIGMSLCLASEVPVFDLSGSTTFTDGERNYRYLTMDETNNVLYVGAMQFVYRLNSYNIADRGNQFAVSPELRARDTDIQSCEVKYQPVTLHCRNHIRVLVVQGDEIYGCGTGAYYPLEFTLATSNLSPLGTYPPVARNSGVKKCPHSPDGSYATLYVEHGNPSQIPSLYTATETTINSIKQLFSRPALMSGDEEMSQYLQTVDTNVNVQNKWLHEATFVSSFETSTHVYLFFNEIAMEYSMARNVPRVARVCKNDLGGSRFSILEELWTTFVKVRLNCSLPGSNPFYFDYLRDVKRIGDTYYVLFSTAENSMNGSAICHFTQGEIDSSFEGTFMEYDNDMGWIEVEESRVPNPRPGTCNNYSLSMSDNVLNFIYSHPLMYNALSPDTDEPIHYCPLVVADRLIVDTTYGYNNELFVVFFLITAVGDIQKVAYSPSSGQTKVVAELQPFVPEDPPLTVQAALGYGGNMYLSTDKEIKQVSMEQCLLYSMCTDCVQDPHCGWSQLDDICVPYSSGHFQAVFGDALMECESAGACYKNIVQQRVRVPGDAVYMSCESLCSPNNGLQQSWHHNNDEVTIDNLKYLRTADGGLVLLNATQMDSGRYDCKAANYLLASHQVETPDCDASDEACIWKEEFRIWCSAFEEYRSNYNQWVCVKDECIDNQNCEADQISQCSAP